MRRETVRQTGIPAIDDQRVLREIVGSHTEKVAHFGQPVRHYGGGRRLDHDTQRHRLGSGDAVLLEPGGLFLHHLSRVTSGIMRCSLAVTAARSTARICVRNISGSSRQTRIARQPRNGFASAWPRNGAGNLSPPRS